MVVQDADLEYDPRDILAVIQPIAAGWADAVYGSRFLSDCPQDQSWFHRMGNRLLTKFSNWTTGLDLTDMETAYKAFRKSVLQSFEVKQPRFGFEPEVTARIARRKFRLSTKSRSATTPRLQAGQKMGVRDLFSTLYCIVRYGLLIEPGMGHGTFFATPCWLTFNHPRRARHEPRDC